MLSKRSGRSGMPNTLTDQVIRGLKSNLVIVVGVVEVTGDFDESSFRKW